MPLVRARLLRSELTIGRERAFSVARAFERCSEKEECARIRRAKRDRRAKGAQSARVVACAVESAAQCKLRVEVLGHKLDGSTNVFERGSVVSAHGLDDREQNERVRCA